jgi:O-antigen/teichoic acid export membrane protein
MNTYKLFIQRMGLMGITNLLSGLSGIVLLPILTRNMPIDEYGMWVQITITVGLLPTILALGLQNAMVRYIPSAKSNEEIREIFYSFLFAVVFISVILLVLLYSLLEWFC